MPELATNVLIEGEELPEELLRDGHAPSLPDAGLDGTTYASVPGFMIAPGSSASRSPRR